jgi:hypothetical protein
MDYNEAKLKMQAMGLPFDKTKFKRPVYHHDGETLKHFILKSLIVYIFNEVTEPVFSELPIGKGIFDVFNLDRLFCYEVETKPSKDIATKKRDLLEGYKDEIDVIIIDADQFSDNIFVAYDELKKILI